jgi:hypothetical protein
LPNERVDSLAFQLEELKFEVTRLETLLSAKTAVLQLELLREKGEHPVTNLSELEEKVAKVELLYETALYMQDNPRTTFQQPIRSVWNAYSDALKDLDMLCKAAVVEIESFDVERTDVP